MRLKIVNKRRFIISFTILCFIIIVCLSANVSGKSNEKISYNKRHIYNGDTLWSIAEEQKNNNWYYKDKDVRYIIYDIKNINNMENSNVYEGQELYIPYISNI